MEVAGHGEGGSSGTVGPEEEEVAQGDFNGKEGYKLAQRERELMVELAARARGRRCCGDGEFHQRVRVHSGSGRKEERR
jgi:hypothetical protein